MGELMASSGFPLVLLAFLIATFVRVAQGSATVAMITAAGLVSPIIDMVDLSQPSLALIAIAIACGATVLSHVNDSGFWLVSRFLEMSEKDTLKSWTVMETIIGGVGFLVVFGLSFFFFIDLEMWYWYKKKRLDEENEINDKSERQSVARFYRYISSLSKKFTRTIKSFISCLT